MIDITDESYESDLSEEESNKLLLMCGHAVGPQLSPAAQAVLDAANSSNSYGPDDCLNESRWIAAAALRAAAYQVAPARPTLDSCCEHYEQAIRHKLLAIATELEGQ